MTLSEQPTASTSNNDTATVDDTSPCASSINVGKTEREVSLIAGAFLGMLALKKPLSLQGLVMTGLAAGLIHRGVTGRCGLYKAMNINSNAVGEPASPEEYSERGIHVDESITIMKSPGELYAFWKDLNNLPRFMDHVKDVTRIDDKTSHWKTRGPLDYTVEWDAEIINDEPEKLIAWQSIGNAEVDNAGSVRFLPYAEGAGTEVRVTLDYIPPAGAVGHYAMKLLGQDPSSQIKSDLRKLKQLLEAGEVATNNAGQPRGTQCAG